MAAVSLRAPRPSDAHALDTYLHEADIADSVPGMQTTAGMLGIYEFLESVSIRMAMMGELHYVIDAQGKAVGMCVLYGIKNSEAEIGYWIGSENRRRGYATAAIALLAGKAALMGITRLHAKVDRSNAASASLLVKAGFSAAGSDGCGKNDYVADTANIKA